MNLTVHDYFKAKTISLSKAAGHFLGFGAMGYLEGHIYGRLADLPSKQIEIGLAISNLATIAIVFLGHNIFVKYQLNLVNRSFLHLFAFPVRALCVLEMTKRGLLGPKMIIFQKSIIAIDAVCFLNDIFRAKKFDKQVQALQNLSLEEQKNAMDILSNNHNFQKSLGYDNLC